MATEVFTEVDKRAWEKLNQQQLIQEPQVSVKKVNRDVAVALRHLNKRREALLTTRAKLTKEIEELDAAILALG